jgi:hypothetical protein
MAHLLWIYYVKIKKRRKREKFLMMYQQFFFSMDLLWDFVWIYYVKQKIRIFLVENFRYFEV